jgi:preprotein translocase subunit SecF
MRIFHNFKYDFLKRRQLAYIISGSFFLIGLLSVVFRGFHFGVDFTGGSEIVLQFEQPVQISSVRSYVDELGLGSVEAKTFGSETGVMLRTKLQSVPPQIYPKVIASLDGQINKILPGVPKEIVDSSANSITYSFANPETANLMADALSNYGYQIAKVSEENSNRQIRISVGISDWIKENLRFKIPDNKFIVLKEDKVGPKIGEELKTDALLAVFFSLIGILIYLAFRFKFIFALGAVVALFHDVLITLGLYAALYGVIPGLNLEIDLTIVAAFLTLIGYSVNDTVVVFDRIRENLKIHKTRPIYEVINDSMSQTMSRTLLTGGTTLLSLLVLLIFGGEVIRAFAFTMFFGIIIGTYSSVFVASVLVYVYVSKTNKKIEF